jgi:TolB-like protein/DNA-binding winged helix-turn-helix (wHTH) protein/tetratricopeptide (TPR) repeat protein
VQVRKARFGAFEIDLRSGELRKHGIKIKLQNQPFQVLQLLLERPGEIVTREELRSKLWPENTFVDFDVGLNTAIKRLRDALSDSAENSHYVETLPRRGYRFIAAVEPVDETTTRLPGANGQSQKARATPRHWKIWSVGSLVVLIGSLLLYLNLGTLRQRLHRQPTPIQSIAVLPLENLSGDPAQEYFVDGMTDALTTDLGKIGQLRVVSKTSMMRYKGTKKSLQDIAKEIGVDALVEGGVTRSGDRIRITANLVQVAPEKHLWADSFEASIQNVLDLQDDASRAIANAIQVKLSPQEKVRLTNSHPVNPQAYDAYLQGQFFAETPGPDAGEKATEYFEQAIRDDPAWSLPYSGLARMVSIEGSNRPLPNENCTRAKDAALEALKRDPESPEAHTVFADIEYFCEWNWADAEREVARAIEINPNLAQAHSSRGRYLLTMGKTGEMLEETRRAVELDPLSFRIRWDRWISLYAVGRYDEALEQCHKIQELNPNLDLGYLYCSDVYVQKGNLTEAVQGYEKAVTLTGGKNPRTIAHLAYAYALADRRNDAQKLLANLIAISKQRYVHPDLIALVYLGLGQKETAIEWLDKAYQVRARDLLDIRYDPQFAELRTDQRFVDLVRRIGLPPL